jgi:hypothetical protein
VWTVIGAPAFTAEHCTRRLPGAIFVFGQTSAAGFTDQKDWPTDGNADEGWIRRGFTAEGVENADENRDVFFLASFFSGALTSPRR